MVISTMLDRANKHSGAIFFKTLHRIHCFNETCKARFSRVVKLGDQDLIFQHYHNTTCFVSKSRLQLKRVNRLPYYTFPHLSIDVSRDHDLPADVCLHC